MTRPDLDFYHTQATSACNYTGVVEWYTIITDMQEIKWQGREGGAVRGGGGGREGEKEPEYY